jgi:hypothetical protein
LALALMVGLWASVQKSREQAVMLATPNPLDGELPTSTALPTDLPPTPTASPLSCPTDTQDWQLLSVWVCL